ncbi:MULTISPECIES: TolC family protein [unclassified Duganella]|uniref:TolC family protein n=1 Tax=unclassified Duganella TaxID=2636909 RepID=UPI001E46B6DA|nr:MULTISPECIES: TolC family protein [unclassified Duganella]
MHLFNSNMLLALLMWAVGEAGARPVVPELMVDPQPAMATDATAPAVLRLSIQDALQGALTRAVVIQTQQLDVEQQQLQTEQARHEFLPQAVLSSQWERERTSATGAAATRGAIASGNLLSTWKLRSGTQLSLSEGRQYNRDGQAVPMAGPDATGTPNNNSRTSSLSLTQPLLRGAGGDVVLLNEHRAALALESARKGFLQTQRDVVLGGVVAYFGLEQAQQNVALAQAALKRAAEARSINEELLAAGRISRIALLQSDADAAQTELALMQSRQAENVARRQLLRVIGRYDLDADRTAVTLADSFISYLPMPSQGVGAAMQAALARRVDLELAADAVKAGQFGVIEADDGLRNQLDFYVRRDQSSDNGAGPTTRRSNIAVGLNYSIPLDKSAARVASSAARIALRKAELSRADLKRNARAEVSDALKNIEFAALQYRMAQRTAELARQRLAAEIEKTRAGRSSATDLSLAQDALNQTLSQETQAHFAIFMAQLELQRVSGTVLEQWHVASLAQDTGLPP